MACGMVLLPTENSSIDELDDKKGLYDNIQENNRRSNLELIPGEEHDGNDSLFNMKNYSSKSEKVGLCKTCSKNFATIWELGTNVKFLQLLFLLFCSAFSLINTLAFIPPYVETDLKLPKTDANVFLTVSGGCTCVGRILFGLVGDWKAPYRKHLAVTAQSVTGILVVGIVTTCYPSYTLMMAYMVTLGLFGSVFLVYAGPLFVDTVGSKFIGISFGLFGTLSGFGIFIGPPVFGKHFCAKKRNIWVTVALHIYISN